MPSTSVSRLASSPPVQLSATASIRSRSQALASRRRVASSRRPGSTGDSVSVSFKLQPPGGRIAGTGPLLRLFHTRNQNRGEHPWRPRPVRGPSRPQPTTETSSSEAPLMKWTRTHSILAATGAAVAGVGAALFAWRRRNGEEGSGRLRRTAAARPRPARSANPAPPARPAPRRCATRPKQWDREDQASDESFPASDPPPAQSKVD